MKKDLPFTGDRNSSGAFSSEPEILDKIINHSRSMISVINRDYVYEKVNDTFCREHQKVSNSVVGKSLPEVWGEEIFQNNIKSKLDRCFSGEIVSYEASFNTPRLGKRHYEVVFRPLRMNEIGITHLLAETFDINELKISRQKALDKEEELRKFETNIPIGFVRCNTDGKIVYANKAFLRIMECPCDITGLNLNMRNFFQADVLFEIQVEQLLESRSKAFGRVMLRSMKGTEIACRINGFLAFDRSEIPLYIDLTIEDSSRELMLENKLLQAQKLETIGALAGGIAHDFNNILAIISGYSEILMEDLPKDSHLSENVSKIQGAVQKAHSIINQILTFSRHVEQEKIEVNVAEVLKETIGFVRYAVPPDIVIRNRIYNRRANILADPTQLFRVFLNLMTNSIQSMEERGGILSVRMSVIKAKKAKLELNSNIVADEYIVISFSDTGIGMDPSLIERIFEPFFTTREVGRGTGLGLSVIHGIVRELEGEIIVSSHREKGSTFNVYLPVMKDLLTLPEDNKIRKRVLFITGNKHESRVLSIALEKSGFDLLYIADRISLARMMSKLQERPDLIIYMSDSRLVDPDDVISVYSQLRIQIPCLLITDANLVQIEEKLLNSGIIKQHLVKPVSLKEIRNAIQILLSQA